MKEANIGKREAITAYENGALTALTQADAAILKHFHPNENIISATIAGALAGTAIEAKTGVLGGHDEDEELQGGYMRSTMTRRSFLKRIPAVAGAAGLVGKIGFGAALTKGLYDVLEPRNIIIKCYIDFIEDKNFVKELEANRSGSLEDDAKTALLDKMKNALIDKYPDIAGSI